MLRVRLQTFYSLRLNNTHISFSRPNYFWLAKACAEGACALKQRSHSLLSLQGFVSVTLVLNTRLYMCIVLTMYTDIQKRVQEILTRKYLRTLINLGLRREYTLQTVYIDSI